MLHRRFCRQMVVLFIAFVWLLVEAFNYLRNGHYFTAAPFFIGALVPFLLLKRGLYNYEVRKFMNAAGLTDEFAKLCQWNAALMKIREGCEELAESLHLICDPKTRAVLQNHLDTLRSLYEDQRAEYQRAIDHFMARNVGGKPLPSYLRPTDPMPL